MERERVLRVIALSLLSFPVSFQGEQSMTFDVETAIKVCHQANYHRHALALARKYQRHDWLVYTCVYIVYICLCMCMLLYCRTLPNRKISIKDISLEIIPCT